MRKTTLWILAFSLSAPAFAADGRKPIWLGGTVITEPGHYVVTRNIPSSGSVPAIEIMTSNVDLDLNGMSVGGGDTAPGVRVGNIMGEITIRNGSIEHVSEGISITSGSFRVLLEDLLIHESSGAGIHIANSENFVIRRVTIKRVSGDGILLDGVLIKHGTIESVQVRDTFGTPIRVSSGSTVALIGNEVDTTSLVQPGIWLESCAGCLLADNRVHDTGREGILLQGFTGGKVYANVVARAGVHGIVLDSASSDSLVRDNVVTGSGEHTSSAGCGLLVEGDRITVEGNTLNSNRGAGLRLATTSSEVSFGRNTARGNAGVGTGPCAGTPALFSPNSCNNGSGNTSSGGNLIPGPPVF